MNVKPRLSRKDINCVNCGECIQACNKELGYGEGLFSFSASLISQIKRQRLHRWEKVESL